MKTKFSKMRYKAQEFIIKQQNETIRGGKKEDYKDTNEEKSVHAHSHTQAHTQELDYIHELTKCFYFYFCTIKN